MMWVCWIVITANGIPAKGESTDRHPLADAVEIIRDEWGVAHVLGRTDEATLFGMGYVQAEDYFWQLEDNVIRATGRYAEVWGKRGLQSDLLNHQFEVVKRSREDWDQGRVPNKVLATGFAAGINHYLDTHPDVKPRLIKRFEPWHVLCVDRHFLLDFTYGRSHVGRDVPDPEEEPDDLPPDQRNKNLGGNSEGEAGADPNSPTSIYRRQLDLEALLESNDAIASWDWPNVPESRFARAAEAAVGSNQWAIAGSRTRSGAAMLLINPHQPYYGWGQYYEAHLHSEETLRFTGAGFYGMPIPSKGHNGRLGWTYTVNDPDIADGWIETFDDPHNPLHYRYDKGYREAIEWTDTIQVRQTDGVKAFKFRFRKTHHGPIVKRLNEHKHVAVQVSGAFDPRRPEQAMRMIQAQNFSAWYDAARMCAIPMFNISYADQEGTIFYVYNGSIPKRDPGFDWTRPVEGSDPRTEWKGVHPFEELPQVLNPPTGYVQNCNSSPFTTSDEGNPFRNDFPKYMFEDADMDQRRAKMCRKLLRESTDVTFEKLQELAFDTTLYWPLVSLPAYSRELTRLEQTDPELAQKIGPYLQHLLHWNCRAEPGSTETTLCVAWYEELYGVGYPAETMHAAYQASRTEQLKALVKAAESLRKIHGDWQVPWDKVHRLQRVVNISNVEDAGVLLSSWRTSVPCLGAPGPLGIVFTVYSSPSIPWLRPQRFSVVGTSYLATVEFTPRVRAASAIQFGSSSDPKSDHYFDQAELFSNRKLKPAWFYPEDVQAHAVRRYHP
jgi:acyl-homoserine-lactone acylase